LHLIRDGEREKMPLKTNVDEAPGLNLTPMIDVVFQLIIFFMVGTKFAEMERNIALQVPEVSPIKALTPAPERRVINVYRDGRVELDRDFVSLEQLTDQLAAARREYADLGVLVRGDGEGAFQNVAGVLGACRQAGISDLGISVRLTRDP
jgi:biopolymer transport protein ExbD